MPNFKNIIKVNPEKEKRLYRILTEVSRNGESVVDGNSKDWDGTFRKLGIKAKPFIDNGSLEIWIKRNKSSHTVNQRLIRTKKDFVIEEKPGEIMHLFHFKRRKIF
jgi:hypothetical protein